jgi:4-diphosphocytidyl-2-C-methyl-D-erythritol kinase
VEAFAKLNVFLRVLGLRPDGYHDIQSLIVPISLADSVEVTEAPELSVETTGPGAESVSGMNLALVAALALAERCGASGGARIEIAKRIPVAAGLGGGSADAATTLRALDRLWGCGLDEDDLLDIGRRIGSDVPAMLAAAPVIAGGRGEVMERIEVAPTWWALLPLGFPSRSPEAYQWWDDAGGEPGPDPAPLIEAAKAGDLESLGSLLFNDLEAPVAERHPEIRAAREELTEAGALGVVMSGSGPTMAALAEDRVHAEALAGSCHGAVVVRAGN